jgi:hypothetical protein
MGYDRYLDVFRQFLCPDHLLARGIDHGFQKYASVHSFLDHIRFIASTYAKTLLLPGHNLL